MAEEKNVIDDKTEYLKQLPEVISEVFFVTSGDFKQMLYISPGYEKIWGRTTASLYANPVSWLDSIHPDDRTKIIKEQFETKHTEPYQLDYRIVSTNSLIHWIHVKAFPVLDKDGNMIRLFGIAIDVTDQKVTEESLRVSRDNFDLIANSIDEVFFISSGDGKKVIYISPGYEKMWGITREALYANPQAWVELVHPDDRANLLKTAFEEQHTKAFWTEFRLLKLDGTIKWMSAQTTQILDKNGQPMKLVGVIRDITDRKNSDLNLKVSEQRYRSFIEQTPFGVQIFKLDGSLIYANPAWEKLWSSNLSELDGYNIRKDLQLKEGGISPAVERAFTGEIVNIPPFLYDPAKNGKVGRARWVRLIFYPTKDDGGNMTEIILILDDVTELKESEIKTVSLEKDLLFEKAKEDFVSLASHQLRTPLTSIQGYAEMLLNGEVGEIIEKQKEFIQEIYDANRRMLDLVGSLLNVSRIDLGIFSIDPQEINVEELIEIKINELRAKIDAKNIKVTLKLDGLGKMMLDPKIMGIIFQNLLVNAVKYSNKNGEIKVELKQQEPNFVIIISDNGIGIPLGQQDKIFTKLFRADNAVKVDANGTGLGLYMVYKIVGTVGGSIRFESKENEGTTFYLTLPHAGMKPRVGANVLN